MTFTLNDRFCEPIDCNELLESLDCYTIGWDLEVRIDDCFWLEAVPFCVNFLERMLQLSYTCCLLRTSFVIVLLSFCSLTDCAPRPEGHVCQSVNFLLFCSTDGFGNLRPWAWLASWRICLLLMKHSNVILNWLPSRSQKWCDLLLVSRRLCTLGSGSSHSRSDYLTARPKE